MCADSAVARQAFETHVAHYVGRVGALAVALGVGSAIFGFSGLALADTGTTDAAGSVGQESTGGSGQTANRTPRTNIRETGSAASTAYASASVPAPAAATDARTSRTPVETSSGDPAVVRTAREARRSVRGTPASDASTPSVTAPQAPVVSPETAPLVEVPAATPVAPLGDVVPEIVPAVEPVAQEAPVMTASESGALAAGQEDPLAALGGGAPGTEPLAWAAAAVARQEDLAGPTPEFAAAASVTTGEPAGGAAAGAAAGAVAGELAAATFTIPPLPSNPACGNTLTCGLAGGPLLLTARPTLIAQIADAIVGIVGPELGGQAGGCGSGACPVSNANYVGAYGYNIIYALVASNFNGNINASYNTQVGTTVQQFFSQPQILTFVSEAVAAKVAAKYPKLPAALGVTLGNTVSTFLLNSFGNATVAQALVPFLRGLNIPQGVTPLTAFALAAQNETIGVFSAILASGTPNTGSYRAANAQTMLTGLVGALSNSGVQAQLGAALTASVKVLLGQNTQPNWQGAPAVSPTALSDYLGQTAADKFLAPDNPSNPALFTTFSTAFQILFNNIGNVVATSAGTFLQTFLAAPGQNIPTVLSTTVVNGLFNYLNVQAKTDPLPPPPLGPQPPLNSQIAGAAGIAATAFVNSLLVGPNLATVTQGLGQFVAQVIPGVLGNVGIQGEVQDKIAAKVASNVPGDLGALVGEQIGGAFAALLGSPPFTTALVNLVNTTLGTFLTSTGVGSAIADVSGQYVTGRLDGLEINFLGTLLAEQAVIDAVGPSVTAGTAQLLGDAAFWSAVDSTVTGLVNELLGDTAIQTALGEQVAATVSKALGGGELGAVVGAQVGAAVVTLVTTPTVQLAIKSFFDTIVGDFWRSPDVVTAYSEAAGTLATAFVTGTIDTVRPVVVASLQANPAVQNAVQNSVGIAVAQLLGNTALWYTVNTQLTSLIDGLLDDPVVQVAVGEQVASLVSNALGGGQLGAVVGAQVGATAVALITNETVQSAVHNFVDTIIVDFFYTPGVVQAYSTAAGSVALAAFTGGDVPAAIDEAGAVLRANQNVQNAVQNSMTSAVAQLLSNKPLWTVVNLELTMLVDELLSDSVVQQAVGDRVASGIAAVIGGQLGVAVGAQVGATVVALISNETVQIAVHNLVDTVVYDFFTWPGVSDAYANAVGDVALVAFTGGDVPEAIEQQKAILGGNPQVQTAVQVSVTTAVAELLRNLPLWQVVDTELSLMVHNLLDDLVVQNAVGDRVTETIAAKLGGQLGVVVGGAVAQAVILLMDNPVVQSGVNDVVDTVVLDFFKSSGVVTAYSNAAGDLALALVSGQDFDTALAAVKASLQANPYVDNAVRVSVGAGTEELLTNALFWQAVNDTVTDLAAVLLTDPVVQQGVDERVASGVSTALGGGQAGALVGAQVGAAVVSLMGDAAVQTAVNQLLDTVLIDFVRAPGVVPALSDAAGDLAFAAVTGENIKDALAAIKAGLAADPDIQNAAQVSVGAAVTGFIGDTGMWSAVGGTVDTLVTNLLGDTVVQQYAGQAVGGLVATYLGASPIAAPVGQAVGTAVAQFLATPGVAPGFGAVIGSVVPDLFGQTGIPAEIGSVAGQFVVDRLTGESLTDAVLNAVEALASSPAIQLGLKTTIANTLDLVDTQLLGVATIQQALGATVTSLIVDLAGDPTIQSYAAEQYGQPVANLLADTAAISQIATVLGSTVTGMLGYPGFSTALTDAMDVYANAVLAGLDNPLQSALAFLLTNPAYVGAVNTEVPYSVSTLLDDAVVRQAFGVFAQEEVVAQMQAAGINSKFLQNITGRVVGATVEDFLGRRAAAKLLDDVAVGVLLGEVAVADVENYVIDAVLHRPVLQIALGFSLGQGIGSLFGDNPIGYLIGVAAGIPATIFVGIAAGLINVYQWLFRGRALRGDSHYYQPVPAASDMYVMNAIVPDWQQADAVRAAMVGDGTFTLTGLTLTEPDGDQSGSVDLTMTVDTADSKDGESPAPLLVAFRFPLDRLLPGLAGARTAQTVG